MSSLPFTSLEQLTMACVGFTGLSGFIIGQRKLEIRKDIEPDSARDTLIASTRVRRESREKLYVQTPTRVLLLLSRDSRAASFDTRGIAT